MLLATSVLSLMAQEGSELIAGLIALFFTLLMFAFIAALLIVPMWKIFTKAGKPGWASLVPIYNLYVMTEIVGRPAWWMLLFFVPVANIVAAIILYIDLARSYGKGDLFGIGLVFLSFICIPILGYGSAQYIGPAAAMKMEKAI